MRYRQLFLIFFLSFHFLPKNHTAHAAAYITAPKHLPMSSNTQTVVPGIPTQTSTPTAIPTDTPTTTLLPLPVITLIFPISTSTSTTTSTPKLSEFTLTPTPSTLDELSSLSPRITLLIFLVIILWAFLITFLVIYIRQFK